MATWYAANSTVDINSANEWNAQADGLGAWLTWANLAAADVLNANGKTTININVSLACARIETDSVLGGGFICGATVTITADILAGTTPCLDTSAGTYTVTIVGGIKGGTAASAYGINRDVATATFAITVPSGKYIEGGAGLGIGSVGNATGIYTNATGTININSAVSDAYIIRGATDGNTCSGIYLAAEVACTINGGVVGGAGASSSCYGARNSLGILIINGAVSGGSSTSNFNAGVYHTSSGTTVINGNIFSGTGSALNWGIYKTTIAGSCTITGNLVNNSISSAISGPITYTPAAVNYIELPDATGLRKYYYDLPATSNVLDTDTVGGVAGTYSAEGDGGMTPSYFIFDLWDKE